MMEDMAAAKAVAVVAAAVVAVVSGPRARARSLRKEVAVALLR